MKFTPETLLQIYLDGSFTEEAQTEFDALIRKDPLFAEKVTQAVADRLGPLPETQVDEMAGRLDGKIGAVWNQYKPSPVFRYLKITGKIALALTTAGILYSGVRHFWPMFQTSLSRQPSAMLSSTSSPMAPKPVPGNQTAKGLTLTVPSGEKEPSTSLQTESAPQGSRSQETTFENKSSNFGLNTKNPPTLSSVPSNNESGIVATAPSASNSTAFPPTNGKDQTGQIPSSGSNVPSSAIPPGSSGAASTAEGDSLRVTIDIPKTQDVVVTVYDGNGLLIRHLYQGVLNAGEDYVDWDGKDELGNAVLPGNYTVVLDLGNKKMSGILKVLPNP